jgi:hypothetical protein
MKPMASRRQADEGIRHIRGLELIRAMLAEREADAKELRECDDVIADCRRRLTATTAHRPRRARAPHARAP